MFINCVTSFYYTKTINTKKLKQKTFNQKAAKMSVTNKMFIFGHSFHAHVRQEHVGTISNNYLLTIYHLYYYYIYLIVIAIIIIIIIIRQVEIFTVYVHKYKWCRIESLRNLFRFMLVLLLLLIFLYWVNLCYQNNSIIIGVLFRILTG